MRKEIEKGRNNDVDLFKFSNNTYEVFYNDPKLTKAKQELVEGTTIKIRLEINKTTVDLNASPESYALNICDGGVSICTEWWWDYYHGDEFLYTVYDHTDCYCFGGSGGGGNGGGGSGGNTPPNDQNCDQRTAEFANQGGAISGLIDASGGTVEGDTWNIPYNLSIYTVGTWGLFSYEKAKLLKVRYANKSIWEYQTFDHEHIAEAGGVFGGTRTF